MVCFFRVAGWDMGSAGALAWTLFLRSSLRVGCLTSGMVSIEQCSPRISRDAFGRETTTDLGGGGGGGLASRISNACTSADPGGGGLAASTRTNKPAWVWPVVNSRQPCWSPCGQSYPPLSRHQATQPSEPIERASRRPHQPARPSIAQVDTAVKDIRIVDWHHLRPRFLRFEETWDKCGPLDREKVSEEARPARLNNEMSGGVAVALNPSAMVPGNVDVSVTPLMGDVGSVLPNVASPMVAEGAPLAGRVDTVLIDSVGMSPLAAGGGGGDLSSVVAVVVAVVVPPMVGAEMSVAKDCHRSRDLTCT